MKSKSYWNMPENVGGLWITEYEFTRSFGVEPASASGRAVLGLGEASIGLSVGDYLAYSFGGIVFYGIVSNVTAVTERQRGREYTFQIVDNRVRLSWQWFFAQYNMGEEYSAVHARELLRYPAGEFSSGGLSGDDGVDLAAPSGDYPDVSAGTVEEGSISRGRIFRHRVPSQWAGGFSSYSTNPVSAADILRSAFKSALGGFNYSLDLHSSQNDPVHDVDANNGMTLAALVSMLCDRQGLQCTLDGARTLRFERRGEGTLILPGPPVHVARDGESLSADPTKVRVVGDRTLVQVNNIPMEPDWARGWENLISEPAWLAKVDEHFGPFETTAEGRAELAARAREVTLREYIIAAEADSTFVDHGRWGNVSRMDMEAWSYLNSIVYRSYRVSAEEELYGVPIRQLEVHDSLLCAVEPDGADGIRYRQSPVEFYPQNATFVIAKGQPLDLLSVMDREALVRVRQKDLRDSWSEIPDFTFDPLTHSIRFASPVFIDGDTEEDQSILLFPNKGQGGFADISAEVSSEENEYLRVVVPNPDYVIEPALIKCSMVFRLGTFHRDFGSGARWTVHSAPSISEHLLDVTGSSISHAKIANFTGTMHMPSPGENLREILYDDGSKAIEKAEEAAKGLILKNPVERDGEYIRHGAAGTSPSGVIDRVTIRITRDKGIVETCEFAKPRSARGFVSGRDVTRRVKSEALYEGQEALRREVKMLRSIAKLGTREKENETRSPSHRVITDILGKPAAGGVLTATATYHDVNSQWPEGRSWRAGDLVWLDKDGLPSRSGQNFGGVVVSRPPEGSSHVVCAQTGSVAPVAVAPGVGPGEAVMANPGDWRASSNGSVMIGVLSHGSETPSAGGEEEEEPAVIAYVKLGAGGHRRERFEFRVGGDARDKLFVAPGGVHYCEMKTRDQTADDSGKPLFAKERMPVIDDKRLDDPVPPFFDISDKENGSLWLVVEQEVCSGLPDEGSEYIVLKEKDEKPDIGDTEFAALIAKFDLEDDGEGGKRIKNEEIYLESDWQQWFKCEGNYDPSDDQDVGGNSDGSSGSGSGGSGSGGEDPPRPRGCSVSMGMLWINKVDCFPSAPSFESSVPCTPGRFVFRVQVEFRLVDKLNRACPGWAYSVEFSGSSTPAQVWVNDRIRTLEFAYDNVPACGYITVTWKARGYGPLRGPGNEIIESCCGHIYGNSFPVGKLPPVCGCGCSSSGDLDGDNIPNASDPDVDGDGWNNPFDGDIDGDGVLDEADPDMDGDGVPNESDPTPEGV